MIVLFIIIKIIPLFFISFVAIEAVNEVERQFTKDMDVIVDSGEKVVRETANIAIKDSIYALDMKSQTSLERLTVEIAQNVS
ncbi:hypothetical protein KKA14_01640, partial [bacterium]|nr:hypothetical protein [bacterium]